MKHADHPLVPIPGRAGQAAVLESRRKLLALDTVAIFADSIPDPLIITNRWRQIVYANTAFRDAARQAIESMLGKRPGEALGCVHAHTSREGCGHAPACRFCAAVQTLLASQVTGGPVTQECRISVEQPGPAAFDFRVTATPLEAGGEQFTTVVMRDISAEKRREVLERLFFHDVLNTALGLQGLSAMVCDPTAPPDRRAEYGSLFCHMMDTLIAEIEDQRRLMLAERGELAPDIRTVNAADVVRDVELLYENYASAPGRMLRVGPVAEVTLETDALLLRRVLGNLVKNALEATPPAGRVGFWSEASEGAVIFSVQNPGVMEDEVRHQIFQRSFSTKGEGRGIGLYSVRLLGERYLGGQVSFESAEPAGTIFQFKLRSTAP